MDLLHLRHLAACRKHKKAKEQNHGNGDKRQTYVGNHQSGNCEAVALQISRAYFRTGDVPADDGGNPPEECKAEPSAKREDEGNNREWLCLGLRTVYGGVHDDDGYLETRGISRCH